jgi:hypothetical protein
VYVFGLVNFAAILLTTGGLKRMMPPSMSSSGAGLPLEVVDLMLPALVIFSLVLTAVLVGLLLSARAGYVRACMAVPDVS